MAVTDASGATSQHDRYGDFHFVGGMKVLLLSNLRQTLSAETVLMRVRILLGWTVIAIRSAGIVASLVRLILVTLAMLLTVKIRACLKMILAVLSLSIVRIAIQEFGLMKPVMCRALLVVNAIVI